MIDNENKLPPTETEQKPQIIIRKSADAPAKIKDNPFFDVEIFGMAKDTENVYLPDSDEAISFAIAAHEIGHLTKEGASPKEEAQLDNFEATQKEEQRAWDNGW